MGNHKDVILSHSFAGSSCLVDRVVELFGNRFQVLIRQGGFQLNLGNTQLCSSATGLCLDLRRSCHHLRIGAFSSCRLRLSFSLCRAQLAGCCLQLLLSFRAKSLQLGYSRLSSSPASLCLDFGRSCGLPGCRLIHDNGIIERLSHSCVSFPQLSISACTLRFELFHARFSSTLARDALDPCGSRVLRSNRVVTALDVGGLSIAQVSFRASQLSFRFSSLPPNVLHASSCRFAPRLRLDADRSCLTPRRLFLRCPLAVHLSF